MTPTYYVQHPDGSYSVADPQPQQEAQAVPLEPVYGDVLPPIGSRVFIRHGRDDDAHACTVTGYYAWPDLGGSKFLHRVFVRLVYEGTEIQQARMLRDCYQTAEAALNAAPTPPAQQPLAWLARKAVECLQGAEMTWMPAWNRPVGDHPVPVFLPPPSVKESLTAQSDDASAPAQQPEVRQWVGLTDVGIAMAMISAGDPPDQCSEGFIPWCEKFAAAIETNLKERNT